ncbi:hypothetical protein Godav_000404 [Gossypium davidsonii]|uniref:Uncharacterized protein n=1 Tax=Gossypium davidsonii TaxID=34287 RepID=A0A7J8SZK2_GOSDV|nr:hypothetical protein [Gossypium davidsonii]
MDTLTHKNNVIKAMVQALKIEMEEFKRKFILCKTKMCNWRMEQYFHVVSIQDSTTKVNTASMYLTGMIVAELMIEQNGKKLEKSESSKPKFNPKENDERNKDKSSKTVNSKPPTMKWKSNKLWEKKKNKKPVKCFFCDSSYKMQDCPKRAKLITINKKDVE